ncbi:amino acid adenylation domain-containing protein [Micromonospora sp. NPDC007271]|uniref:amino acid adenylation domain-containing protein n=1 Tax=Micromonospora sp. NPDC007271 TaxID=3154587 RepID=UPI0033C654B0
MTVPQEETAHAGTIHEWVSRQATRRPDATAVVGAGERLSYAELDRRSDELARRLGTAPEAVVAVCAARRPHLVVAMLAALKAGAACLPIDRSYPAERIAHLLADSGCPVVLADAAARAVLPPDRLVVAIDGEPARPARADDLAPVLPEQAAMVLYTSGSTGQPKGVVLSHRNVLTLLTGEELLRHGPEDRVAHVLSSSFDAVLLDVWGALAAGATVWLASEEALRSVGHLYDEVAEADLTVLPLTSSLLHQLVQVRPEQARRTPRLWFGGEAAESAAARRAAGPDNQLVHHYGPTECTSIATVHLVTDADRDQPVLPIGRPLPTIRLYLLDDQLRPVPDGDVGEIHLGGPQVGRGYLGQPRLTADRFLPDPFAADGGRMYRTGDLGRRLPSGEVQFAGRTDDQVKIRGYRVEPAEVSAALRRVPGVADAAVIARDDVVPGTLQLVAYLVGHVPEDTVAAALARTLPSHLLPAAYVRVDSLPLLPNHKLAVRQLPPPPRARHQLPRALAASVQDRLAALWCEILDRESVRPEDSFFALGGYSLLAARLMARIEQAFHTRLPLRALFNARTLRDLAQVVERELGTRREEPAPPVGAEASPAQRELWLLHQMNPGGSDYNSALAFSVRGGLDLAALQDAVNDVVGRHDALRWTFHSDRGRCVVREADQVEIVPAVTDDPGASDEDVERWLRRHREIPFDLAAGPPLRLDVLVTHPQRAVLLFTVHHIVFDGWSAGIFVDELAACYRARRHGRPTPLPPLEHRYRDVVWREQRALADGELDEQIAYWRQALRDAPPAVELPAGDPDLAATAAVEVTGTIDEVTAGALRDAARDRGRTPFVLLLSAYGLVIRALAGVDDVVVSCPNAGRRGPAAGAVIGLFAHLLPIRLTVGDEQSVDEYVACVAERVVGAITHQAVPFERIVQEVRPPRRRRSRAPYTQLVFNLVDLAEPTLELDGAIVEPVRVAAPETRVPMAVILNEDGAGYRVEVLADPRDVAPAYARAVRDALPGAVALVAAGGGRSVAEAANAIRGPLHAGAGLTEEQA